MAQEASDRLFVVERTHYESIEDDAPPGTFIVIFYDP